jgi:hypothetical protein
VFLKEMSLDTQRDEIFDVMAADETASDFLHLRMTFDLHPIRPFAPGVSGADFAE